MEDPSPLHIMVLPFNAQGHLNPMLSFSALLTYRGCIVTFVTSHRSHRSMVEAYEPSSSKLTSPFDLPNMRFVSIPDVAGVSELKPDIGTLKLMLEGAEQQQGLIEEIICNSSPPITCIVADSFFQWTQDLASKLGISRAMFWASNSASLYHASLLSSPGKAYPHCLPLKEDELFFYISDSDAEDKKQFSIDRFKRIDEAACILVNSVRELDSSFLQAVELKPPIRCIGPCLTLEEGSGEQVLVSSVRASLLKEEMECLKWLDNQAKCSVVYIAFGSIARLSDAQVEELAAGLEASGEPFLWVTRAGVLQSQEDIASTHGDSGEEDVIGDNVPSSSAQYAGLKLPQTFLEHTHDRGLVISWAPQLRVLAHPAISCFFTHCGWNSVMDSLSMNVPMLCLPFFGDQFINEQLIVKVWQVGFGFERRTKLYQHVLSCSDAAAEAAATQNKHHDDQRTTVEMDMCVFRQEIEAALKKLLHSEDGNNARVRVSNWRSVIHLAMREGGSSRLDLDMFVEDMINVRGCSSLVAS